MRARPVPFTPWVNETTAQFVIGRREWAAVITADDERYLASLREIRAYADAEPRATIVPTHDPGAWRDV